MYKTQLRKRPTYDEIIGYLENKQPEVKYPNRLATQISNTPQMSQFLGDGNINMHLQQENMLKQQLLLLELEKAGVSRREAKAKSSQTVGNQTNPASAQTEYYDLDSDAENVDDTINKEEHKTRVKREETASAASEHLSEEAIPHDAAHRMAEENAAEKRAASQEARPGREKKTSKASHEWHKGYRSRSPRYRLRSKSAPPTDTLPPVPPPPTPPPPKQSASSSSTSYPTLNKDHAKEKIGTIKRKDKVAAAPTASTDDEGAAASNTYGIAPSKIGIQVLRELFENAYNKQKISIADDNKFQIAYGKYLRGTKEKDDALKRSSLKEIQDLYKRLFYKKPTF